MVRNMSSGLQFTSMLAMPLAPVLAGVLLAGLGGRDAVLALTALTALVALIPTLSPSVRPDTCDRDQVARAKRSAAGATCSRSSS